MNIFQFRMILYLNTQKDQFIFKRNLLDNKYIKT